MPRFRRLQSKRVTFRSCLCNCQPTENIHKQTHTLNSTEEEEEEEKEEEEEEEEKKTTEKQNAKHHHHHQQTQDEKNRNGGREGEKDKWAVTNSHHMKPQQQWNITSTVGLWICYLGVVRGLTLHVSDQSDQPFHIVGASLDRLQCGVGRRGKQATGCRT